MLHNLIYISKAIKLYADDELLDLLFASRKKNENNAVSGMLLYVKQSSTNLEALGRFIQVLEGTESDVLSLYYTIKHDNRHRQVTLLHSGPVINRSFAGWTMGFRSLLEEEYFQIPGFIKLDDNNLNNQLMLSSGVALNFLKSFYSISHLT